LLPGRDPVAVTAVQFLGAAIAVLPVAMLTGGMPTAPTGAGAVSATAALVIGGTLVPFTLFAYGQSRVSAEVAGAFLNLEPLVGAIAGVVVFGNPVGLEQVTGGAAILAGIALGSLPLLAGGLGRPSARPGQVPRAAAGGETGPPLPDRAAAGAGGRAAAGAAGRVVRPAGQQRLRRPAVATVRDRRRYGTRGHPWAGRAAHHPVGSRGARDRPPPGAARRRPAAVPGPVS
jgi:hypothetical protein